MNRREELYSETLLQKERDTPKKPGRKLKGTRPEAPEKPGPYPAR